MCVFHATCISRWAQVKDLPVEQCCPQRCRLSETIDLDDRPVLVSDGVSPDSGLSHDETGVHDNGGDAMSDASMPDIDEAAAVVTNALNILTSNGYDVTVSDRSASTSEALPQSLAPFASIAPALRCNVTALEMTSGLLDEGLTAVAIVQQLNCVGCGAKGLAAEIARMFPYGCSYWERRLESGTRFARSEDRAVPGTIDVRYPYPYPGCVQGPIVINCFAQWAPGSPGYRSRVPVPRGPLQQGLRDTQGQREVWFQECLQAIGRLRPIPSPLAFPKNIGCGLGGGHWPNYETMIMQFAIAHPECEVMIVSRARDARVMWRRVTARTPYIDRGASWHRSSHGIWHARPADREYEGRVPDFVVSTEEPPFPGGWGTDDDLSDGSDAGTPSLSLIHI